MEVDGEVDDPGSLSPGDRAPRWGLPVAIAVAAALLLAVLVLVVVPALTRSGDTRSTDAASSSASDAIIQRERATPAPADPRIDAAGRAVAAWGQFAVTGDLASLDGLFDKDGPQYRTLSEEVPRLVAGGGGRTPYQVTLSTADVVSSNDGEAIVKGNLIWQRKGESDQVHSWEIVLRRADNDRWVLWTVRDA